MVDDLTLEKGENKNALVCLYSFLHKSIFWLIVRTILFLLPPVLLDGIREALMLWKVHFFFFPRVFTCMFFPRFRIM